jgi:hypothetical protein
MHCTHAALLHACHAASFSLLLEEHPFACTQVEVLVHNDSVIALACGTGGSLLGCVLIVGTGPCFSYSFLQPECMHMHAFFLGTVPEAALVVLFRGVLYAAACCFTEDEHDGCLLPV